MTTLLSPSTPEASPNASRHTPSASRVDTSPSVDPAPTSRKTAFRPSEWMLVAALVLMNVLAWLHPSQVTVQTRLSLLTVLFLFSVASASLGEGRTGWRYWAREFLPVPVIPYIFLTLGRLIPLVNDRILDDLLLEADRRLLGVELQAAIYTISLPAWLTELLTLAYASFFFLPITLLIALGIRRDPTLPRVAAAIVLTFLVSYAGYFVIPAYGPRATVAEQRYLTLEPGLVGAWLRDLLDHWEKTKTDVFPSGHTMVTLAVLFCARRRMPALYDVLLPIGGLLIAATVLLTYHYVIDIVAAVPLTVISLGVSAWLAGPVSPRRNAAAT